LCYSGGRIPFHTHELVWEAFREPVKNGLVIAHENAERDSFHALCNCLANLHPATKSENGLEAVEQGLLPKGEKHWRSTIGFME